MVENAFGILKQTFQELLNKTDLNIAFVLDVITACYILHNMLLRQSAQDVERLLNLLRTEGFKNRDDIDILEAPPMPQAVVTERQGL